MLALTKTALLTYRLLSPVVTNHRKVQLPPRICISATSTHRLPVPLPRHSVQRSTSMKGLRQGQCAGVAAACRHVLLSHRCRREAVMFGREEDTKDDAELLGKQRGGVCVFPRHPSSRATIATLTERLQLINASPGQPRGTPRPRRGPWTTPP